MNPAGSAGGRLGPPPVPMGAQPLWRHLLGSGEIGTAEARKWFPPLRERVKEMLVNRLLRHTVTPLISWNKSVLSSSSHGLSWRQFAGLQGGPAVKPLPTEDRAHRRRESCWPCLQAQGFADTEPKLKAEGRRKSSVGWTIMPLPGEELQPLLNWRGSP